MIKSIEWTGEGVVMLDQRLLPGQEVYNTYKDYLDVAEAIRSMVIRGAPAIGIAGAMGVALGMKRSFVEAIEEVDGAFEEVCGVIAAARPTAVNLSWAVARMRSVYRRTRGDGVGVVLPALESEALAIQAEELLANERMGRFGQVLIPENAHVLTHCNTGSLATAGMGTALGLVRAAVAAGKRVAVYAQETRPLLQGARLTAWELRKENIPVTVVIDSMAGHLMQKGKVDCVLVGADRIAANGDVANKIGTYSLAVLAREHNVPFYVSAPVSTLDLSLPDGMGIPIEQRDPDEVRWIQGVRVIPDDVSVENPAFDITPYRFVSAIVTDSGICRPPYVESLKEAAHARFRNGDR